MSGSVYDDFEETLETIFGDKIRTSDEFCKELWSALANVDWYQIDPEVRGPVEYSFRAAGGLIAEIRGSGDYLDWYCSGPYATVSEFIERSMKKAGWWYDNTPMVCDEPGCLRNVGCGWNDGTKYRNTCEKHWRNKPAETGKTNGKTLRSS